MEKEDRQTDVGSLVKQVLENHPAFLVNPIGDWKDLVGEQVARYSRPISLKNGRLIVVVYDSIWKHHLELIKERLLEKINENRESLFVKQVILRVGQIPEEQPELNPNSKLLKKISAKRRRCRRRKVPLRRLTDEEKALLKQLPDPELRTIATRLLRKIPVDRSDS